MAHTVIVLGGGVGGLVAAHRLRRRLPRSDRVVLVDRATEYQHAASYLWVLNGTRRRPDRLARRLARLRRHGIDLQTAEVTGIDVDKRQVETTTGALGYDRLVVALGAQLVPDAVPGFADAAHNFYHLGGALAGHDGLQQLSGGRVAVVVSRLPYKCPAAPWEAALLSEALLRRRGVRDRCTIDVYTPEPLPMPVAGPKVGQAVVDLLTRRGIGIHPGQQLDHVDAGERTMVFTDGTGAGYDLLLGVPVHQAPPAVSGSALAGPNGFIPVDPHTLATRHEGVYAIGDVAATPIAGGKFLPKAGVFAHTQGQVVADRIADELAGRAPTGTFDGHGACFLESGGGRAAYATGDFYAPDGPVVRMRPPARRWHLGKAAVERYWLARWWW
jgi:sulfide:quinone oxidoreductase